MKSKFKEILQKIQEAKDEKLTENSKILILDGLNTFLRCFSIINQVNLYGEHIGGLVGSLKSIGYAIKITNPTKVIIVFDGQGSSASKKNLYPDYKANRGIGRITNYTIFQDREEENESINNQMFRLIQYLQCLPLGLICIDGLEADDIIGYLVNKYEKDNTCSQITIMSADQDFLQLTTNKTQIYSPTKKKIYQPNQVLEEYNVHPNNFIIMKTLLGDNSDNIPGINGLGPKKLQKLFPELQQEQIYSLKEVFNKSQEGDHKLYSNIIERQYQVEINYKLMNLKEYNISPENIRIIENLAFNKLNKLLFLQMYRSDLLGESIPGIESWLNIFNEINYFIK